MLLLNESREVASDLHIVPSVSQSLDLNASSNNLGKSKIGGQRTTIMGKYEANSFWKLQWSSKIYRCNKRCSKPTTYCCSLFLISQTYYPVSAASTAHASLHFLPTVVFISTWHNCTPSALAASAHDFLAASRSSNCSFGLRCWLTETLHVAYTTLPSTTYHHFSATTSSWWSFIWWPRIVQSLTVHRFSLISLSDNVSSATSQKQLLHGLRC